MLVFAIPSGGTSAMIWGVSLLPLIISHSLTMRVSGRFAVSSSCSLRSLLLSWDLLHRRPEDSTIGLSNSLLRNTAAYCLGWLDVRECFIFRTRLECSADSNTIGIIAGVASVDWGCAVQIMAAASIGSNLSFSATMPQTLYVYTPVANQ